MTPSYGGNDDPPPAQQHRPLNGSPTPAAPPQRGLAAAARLRALQATAACRLIATRMRLSLTMRLRVWLVAALSVTPVPAPRRRVFPGHPREVAQARRFVASLLADCPVADTAVLLTSEVVTNALAHTLSGDAGTFEVVVWRGARTACVAVVDSGAAGTPAAGRFDPDAEAGRGLALVASLAARWGHEGGTAGRAVWFMLRWPGE